MRLSVLRRESVAVGIVRLTLADPSGARLPAWMPGAHIDLTGPTGVVRQYSLCGKLDNPWEWQVMVLLERDGRGGSTAIHDLIFEGSSVLVDGPRNHFRMVDRRRYVFIAGGIGITPILPMIELLEAQDDLVLQRPWRLLYTGRRLETMALADELAARGDHVSVHASSENGRTDLSAMLEGVEADTAVFCCGPESLIEAVGELCKVNNLDFHAERFMPVVDLERVAQGDAFTVHLARSNRSIRVADGQTIVGALEDIGVVPTCSCREGVCGTCETRVIAGDPDHRDSVLDDDDRDQGKTMMICVSRSKTPELTLDL